MQPVWVVTKLCLISKPEVFRTVPADEILQNGPFRALDHSVHVIHPRIDDGLHVLGGSRLSNVFFWKLACVLDTQSIDASACNIRTWTG
jgi:hypothetical protein